MGVHTGIAWCDATLNLWHGCTKVSQGCQFCYAELLSTQMRETTAWGPKGTRVEVKTWRSILNKIRKRAKKENRRLRVFCQSMSDTFEGPETMGGKDSDNWKLVSQLQDELLGEIIFEYPELDFLLLTKRPENVLAVCHRHDEPRDDSIGYDGSYYVFPSNLWIGTSVEDQKTADERIPHLLQIPATVRFLSCEPLLGEVMLTKAFYPVCKNCDGPGIYPQNDPDALECCPYCDGQGFLEDGSIEGDLQPINWVICGGESGPNARPLNPKWARSIRDQCVEASVPFFFKQFGEWAEMSVVGHDAYWDAPSRCLVDNKGNFQVFADKAPEGSLKAIRDESVVALARVGKKKAGDILDGVDWKQFPELSNV